MSDLFGDWEPTRVQTLTPEPIETKGRAYWIAATLWHAEDDRVFATIPEASVSISIRLSRHDVADNLAACWDRVCLLQSHAVAWGEVMEK